MEIRTNALLFPATRNGDDDHHLGNLDIRLSAKFVAPTPSTIVEVKATFGLRDWSSEWDDKYEGVVRFAVVAE